MFSCLPARTTFVADTKFVSETQKNMSDFFQKHFVSATNVSQFAQQGNIIMSNNVSECVRNNMSLFVTTLLSILLVSVLLPGMNIQFHVTQTSECSIISYHAFSKGLVLSDLFFSQ